MMDQITGTLAKLHVQYVVMQSGFHDDLAAVTGPEKQPVVTTTLPKSNEFRCMPTTATPLSRNWSSIAWAETSREGELLGDWASGADRFDGQMRGAGPFDGRSEL